MTENRNTSLPDVTAVSGWIRSQSINTESVTGALADTCQDGGRDTGAEGYCQKSFGNCVSENHRRWATL